MLSTLKQTLQLIDREDRLKLLVLIPLALIVTGAEVLGASLVYLLMGLVTGASDSLRIPGIGDLGVVTGLSDEHLLVAVAATFGLFFIAKAALKVFQTYAQARIAHNMSARLATRMMVGYLSLPYAVHLHRNSAELIRNANQAVGQLFDEVIKPLVKLAADAMLAVGMFALLISVSPLATGFAILVLGSAALITLKVVQPRLRRLGDRFHDLQGRTLKALQQSFNGVRDIKLLGAESVFKRRYERDRRATARVNYLRNTLQEIPSATIELALLGFILGYFALAVVIGADAPATLTVLGLFAYAGQRLQSVISTSVTSLNRLRFASAPIDELARDLALIESVPPAEDVSPIPFDQALTVHGVTFRYERAHVDAIKNVSFQVEPGKVIGLCGPTGGGKTTLVDLMTGLLEPNRGVITVDELDLREHARGWQRNLGVVPQAIFLTDGSLRENIALAIDDDRIDEDALNEAVELAQLRTFVDSLPDGLDTIVGERGVRVSGGQRQRIAIARALYRRPSVLVFDEGTSALDNATERELMQAITRLRGDHTIIMIAHRLSTVRDANKILFIKDGRVDATGTYDELVANHPEFAALATT